jgi:uncharacterized protein (DUF305 family)
MIKLPKITALLLIISTGFVTLLGYGAYVLFSTLDAGPSGASLSKTSGFDHLGHNVPMDHGSMIKGDRDFLNLMIPHHQEAVDTSSLLLTKSPDPELKAFLNTVILAQTKEIAHMKTWHKQWFMTAWEDDGLYLPMMPSLDTLSPQKAREAYLSGMIKHHEGAVSMAEKIQTITKRKELLDMASAIIKTQSEEVEYMKKLLDK